MVENIVILTGVGIPAQSGVGPFRDQDGFWAKYDLDPCAGASGFHQARCGPASKLVPDWVSERLRP